MGCERISYLIYCVKWLLFLLVLSLVLSLGLLSVVVVYSFVS